MRGGTTATRAFPPSPSPSRKVRRTAPVSSSSPTTTMKRRDRGGRFTPTARGFEGIFSAATRWSSSTFSASKRTHGKRREPK